MMDHAERDGAPIAQLLIVDDEAALVTALCRTLQSQGFATSGVLTAAAALEQLRERPYDIVMTDLRMPDLDGVALLRAAQALVPDLVGIVMTGQGDVETAVEAMRSGALDYILKPFNLNGIMPVLFRAVAVRRLRRENSALLQRVAERAAELELANRAMLGAQQRLHTLSHSISQNLVSPLETISSLCELLIQAKAGPMTDQQRECLATIWANSRQSAQFVQGLLTASGRSERGS